jgi:hypothetical protein
MKRMESVGERREKRERDANIVDFGEGVSRVAKNTEEKLREKNLVTFIVYGLPNAGKSYFADQIMKELRKKDVAIQGGEIKGYEEIPSEFAEKEAWEKWVMLVQYPMFPGDREIERVYREEKARTWGMPEPDGILWITKRETGERNLALMKDWVDLVILNDQARA